MQLNHPETTPLRCPWKYFLPWNRFLVPKRLGTAFLVDSSPGEESDWLSFGQISQQMWCEGRSNIQTWSPGPIYPLSTSLVAVVDYCKDRQNLTKEFLFFLTGQFP